MALTKAQWHAKLKNWVPSWWWQQNVYAPAVFDAMAAVFSQIDADVEALFAETYLDNATDTRLEVHGDERTVARLNLERDAKYRERIRNLINGSNRPAIKALVDSLLLTGQCKVQQVEDFCFCDRGTYVDRDAVLVDPKYVYNFFMLLIDKQRIDTEAYAGRSSYVDRELFLGSDVSIDDVYSSVVAAVDRAKALGVSYIIVEKR